MNDYPIDDVAVRRMRFNTYLNVQDVGSSSQVDRLRVVANGAYPVEARNVVDQGSMQRTVDLPAHSTVVSAGYGTEVDLEVETAAMTNARAAFDFSSGTYYGWGMGDRIRWVWEFPADCLLVDCGGIRSA